MELNFGIVLACVPAIAGLIRHHRSESARAVSSTGPNVVIKKLHAKGDVAPDSPSSSYKTTTSGGGSSGSSLAEVGTDDEPNAWRG